MTISRRLFMGQAAAAGLSLPLQSEHSLVEESPPSALATGKPVPLPAPEVRGFLSKEQLRWHHESHYGGALKSFIKLDAKPTGDHLYGGVGARLVSERETRHSLVACADLRIESRRARAPRPTALESDADLVRVVRREIPAELGIAQTVVAILIPPVPLPSSDDRELLLGRVPVQTDLPPRRHRPRRHRGER